MSGATVMLHEIIYTYICSHLCVCVCFDFRCSHKTVPSISKMLTNNMQFEQFVSYELSLWSVFKPNCCTQNCNKHKNRHRRYRKRLCVLEIFEINSLQIRNLFRVLYKHNILFFGVFLFCFYDNTCCWSWHTNKPLIGVNLQFSAYSCF